MRRLERSYRALALLALNSLVALLLFNLAALVGLVLYRGLVAAPPGPLAYGMDKLTRVYPGRSEQEIDALLRESWSRQYVYAPFVQHREGAVGGRWVNIAPEGFRLSADQGAWPPDEADLSVFVFGGSTTFGYGVADHETIPSRLQAALGGEACGRPLRVYNFGRGNYYGEQERVLFEQLLAAGQVPDVALFIDGLNEWKTTPKFTARLDYLLRESPGQLVVRALKTLPVVQLIKELRGDRAGAPRDDRADRELAEAAIARWLRGKQLIEAVADRFGVTPLFVWQPVPTWEYDLDSHLFAGESPEALVAHGALRHGYRLLERQREAPDGLGTAGSLLWLADLQRGRQEALYVDAVHYTAAFSDEIARHLAELVAANLPCAAAGPR